MIPNAYSDILTKDADRQHLNDAVDQFLAKGGIVTDLCPPPAASQPVTKASPASHPATAPAGESGSEHQDVLAELRDIRAVAAILHRQLDRIEQQLSENANEQEGEHHAAPSPSAQEPVDHSLLDMTQRLLALTEALPYEDPSHHRAQPD